MAADGYLADMGGPPHQPLRLVIVDDHQMVLDGLKAMLQPYREQVEIVGESSDAREVTALVVVQKPDVVLLDVRLRGTSGLDLCAEIRSRVPDCRVVFLTVYDDEQYLYQALRVGAAGYLLKRIRGGELVDHLAGSARARSSSIRRWPAGWRCPRPGCTAASSGPARISGLPSGRARCCHCWSPG